MYARTALKLSAVALLSVTLAGCGVGEARTNEPEPVTSTPLPVEVALARKAEIFAKYRATSTITSDADAPVTARVAGEVVEILVEEGDRVEKGQLLARLDGARLKLELQQARANLEKTEREYRRFVSLNDRGLVSTAMIDATKYELDELQANFEMAQLNYGYTFVRAPIAGVVAARDIKIGQHMNAGDTTFRVTDTSELVAYLQIPQSELAKFAPGHPVSVRVDALPGQHFDAAIARISPVIDARSGTFRATTIIGNDDGLLAPGMFGRFQIAYERRANALLIPSNAVIQEDNIAVVYVVENGEAVRRAISTGIEEDGSVEVLGGLEEHEYIVVTGQGSLRDGSKVLASVPTSNAITG